MPISTEEFDAKFDAGEDISPYLDWDKGVLVEPGELSPGQKLAMIEAKLNELLVDETLPESSLPERVDFNLSVPRGLLLKIGSEAVRLGVSRGKLVESWIEERVGEQKAVQ